MFEKEEAYMSPRNNYNNKNHETTSSLGFSNPSSRHCHTLKPTAKGQTLGMSKPHSEFSINDSIKNLYIVKNNILLTVYKIKQIKNYIYEKAKF